MISEGHILSRAFNIAVEIIIGYIFFFLMSCLVMIPRKNRLQKVAQGFRASKKEIVKVRRFMYLIWTILIAVINIYLMIN